MSLYKDASLVMIPSAYKDGKLYSIRPVEELGSELVTNGSFDTDSDWSKFNATISGGVATMSVVGGALTRIYQSVSYTSGREYRVTASVQGLSGSRGKQIRVMDNGSNLGGLTTSNGLITLDESVQIVSFYWTANANSDLITFERQTQSGDYEFVLDNVSVKEVITNGDFDFSRGSNLAATRVDVNGLIEKGRENLLLQSNQLDTTWTTTDASIAGSQADKDGGTSAWKLTNTNPYGRVVQNVTSSGVNTFSIYAKEGNNPYLRMQFQSVGSDAYFDLSDGSVISTEATIIDAGTEDVGNGWYRVFASVNQAITDVRIVHTGSGGSGGGSTGDYFYLQDAQLEQGLVATDYIETGASTAQSGILEDMPRLDYSGSCPALLLEPQRTNDAAHSEYISAFNNLSAINVDDNATTSPEGVDNAALIYADATSNQHYISNNHSYTSGTAFTISIFAKVRDYDYFFFRVQDFMSPSTTIFNLASGTLATAGSEDSYKIESLNDGWYRISVTYTPTSNAANNNGLRLGFSPTAAYSYTGDNSSGGYVYGYQWEQGSYPTSYIPTYGSSVTRSSENAEDTSLATLSNNYSIFAEVTRTAADAINNLEFLDYRSSSNDRLRIYTYNNGRIRFRTYFNDGTNDSYFTNSGDWNQGDTIKFCFTYDNGSIVIYANGEELHSVSQTLNNLNYLNMETQKIKQVLHFETTLTSSEAIALTTI